MSAVREYLRLLKADDRGATAIEYALIGAHIVIAMIAGMMPSAAGSPACGAMSIRRFDRR